MRLKATGSNILVRKSFLKEVINNGIIMSVKNDPFSEVSIISKGDKVSEEVQVGHKVWIPASVGMKCKSDELGDYLLVDERNILAIVVEE